MRSRTFTVGVGCFVAGLMVQSMLAQSRRPSWTPDLVQGKSPDDDSRALEYGALANVNKDRAKAEAMISRAMKKNPREFWHWVGAGGSYLGVRPR